MLTGSSAPVTACPGANEPAAHDIATAIAIMMQRHILRARQDLRCPQLTLLSV